MRPSVKVLVPIIAVGWGMAMAPGVAHATVTGTDTGGGTISAGATSGSSTAGTSGGPGGVAGDGSAGAQPFCTSVLLVLNDEGGIAPGGPTPGSWYSVSCYFPDGASDTQTEWIADPTVAPAPTVAPYEVALQAERSLQLPEPIISTDPSSTALVNLPTWLWVDGADWHPYSVSASAGPVSATVVAAPLSVTWSMGDGHALACPGPGEPFVSGPTSTLSTTDCSYDYPESSAGEPSPDGDPNDGSFPVTATVTWSVTWSSTGAAGGGTLPTLYTSTTSRLRVAQVESINVSPGTADAASGILDPGP